MFHNYFEDYGYDSCTSRGVCSISPRMASILEIVVLYLKEFANYSIKLKQFGMEASDVKNLILNTLSAFVSNPELSDDIFAKVICTYSKELDKLKQIYDDECQERGLLPEIIHSELQSSESCNVIKSIRQGEQKYIDKLGSQDRKLHSIQELLFFTAKSITIYLLELNSYGEDSERAFDTILELLDTLNIPEVSKSDLKSVLYNAAEEEFALIKKLSGIKKELYGVSDETVVSYSTKPGKTILVDGTNIKELVDILEAVQGMDIDIYTHGEMLTAHTFPKIRRYQNLRGHYGQGTGNSVLDFSTFPGAIFIGRHSIDNIENLYRGRLFTTDIIVPAGAVKIKDKDFEPLIDAAFEAKGFKHGKKVNSGIIGFNHDDLKEKFDKINFNKYESICLITQGNDSYEDKNYFEKFLKLVPDDILVINFSMVFERPNVINIRASYDWVAVFEVISIIKQKIDIKDKPLTAFVPRCDKHITNLILNLLLTGTKKVFMGKCATKNINPMVVEEFCNMFDVTPYGNVKEDYKQFIDILSL